jgi:single-strand selective monofunctional uracil DNA glycosylase
MAGRQAKNLVAISRDLSRAISSLRFSAPVAYVYAPLEYARAPHESYLERFGGGKKEVLLLGMNPGPFGMAQTGVPFGDVGMVRAFLGIEGPVAKPEREHPERPVLGFSCARGEVSGKRLWGFAQGSFGTAERFFERFFVWNYCPLAFLEASGKNRTPDKLPKAEQATLFAACDAALVSIVGELGVSHVVGVGAFASGRAERALAGRGLTIGTVLHPSPASPRANQGWERLAREDLGNIGIAWPDPSSPSKHSSPPPKH